MLVVLKHGVKRVRNGFAARSRELGLSAQHSPHLARRNLKRLVLLYLQPFEREGTLDKEVRLAGLQAEDDGSSLRVSIIDQSEL